MPKFTKRKIFRIVWFGIVAVFVIWNWSTFQAHDLPDGTFADTDEVSVAEQDDKITFKAKHPKTTIEIIFFQGGLTDPEAYAPLCRKMAQNGFTCHLIKMPFRLPQYNYQIITEMFDLKAGNYIIGGHSQGAKMAAQFVYENPQTMKGLFLLGTSHPRDIDLSSHTLPALKLYATNDGLASVNEVLENKEKLPKNTELLLVEGGNHSQFGYLGNLLTDNAADISLEKQQEVVFNHLIDFLTKIRE